MPECCCIIAAVVPQDSVTSFSYMLGNPLILQDALLLQLEDRTALYIYVYVLVYGTDIGG
jgi:hypothetical protein